MLLLALLAPWAANAQTYTVYEGESAYNEYVPFQGYNADGAQHNQMIYPAADLSSDMVGKSITQMVFYIQQWGSYGSNQGDWTVSLGETEATSLSGLDNTTTLTQVYSGQMEYNSEHTTMTITFDDGYVYQGGNLLVDFNHAAAGYRRIYFYGKEVTGASYSYNSQRNFLPRITFTYETPAATPKPSGLAVNGVTHNEATLTWNENGTATSWHICVNGDESNLITANSKPYTLTNLTPLTTYTVKVRSVGASENSPWSNEINFSTSAVATVVGDSWSDDFEGSSLGWELINGTPVNKWCWGTATSNGGTHSLYVSNDNGATTNYDGGNTKIFATKLLQFADGKYEFSFDWICNGESTWDFLRVALVPASITLTAGSDYSTITQPGLPSGWIALDGGKLNLVSEWQTNSVAINVAAGNYYLVLAWRNDSGVYPPAAAVDNVSITKIACDYDVEGLAVSNITTTTADITWTNSEAGAWQVAVKAGTGEWEILSTIFTTNSGTLNLIPSTNYQVKVRAYCDADHQGAWCDAIGFVTECDVISALGYSVNFDEYTAGNNVLPICWSYINTTTTSNYAVYPRIYSSSYYAHSGANILYFSSYYSSSYDPQPQYAILPVMTGLAGMQVALYAKGYNTSSTFKIGTMSNPNDASTFTMIAEQTLTTSYPADAYEYIIPTTCTDNYLAIMIDAATSTRTTNGVYIDDIDIHEPPSCAKPTNVTATTPYGHGATINWNAGNDETAWQICVIDNNVESAPIDVTSKPHTLSGLDPETTYQVKVRANCGGSFSEWTNAISFTTTVACPAPTSLTGEANEFDATITWQGTASSWEVFYSDDNTVTPDDNIDGTATSTTYTKTGLPLGDHYFWVRAICGGEDGNSSWVGPVSVHIGYCVPNPSGRDGKGITKVQFGMGSDVVNNVDETNGLPSTSPYYGDYSAMIGAVQAGVESTVSITYATGSSTVYSYGTIIWIDFNNDMEFSDDEIVYTGTSTQGSGGVPQVLDATITIPATQATGDYRMRIAGADSYFDSYIGGSISANHSACFSSNYSVCHDYTLRVLEAPSCLTPTNVEVTYTGGTSATIGWTSEATAWNMRVNGVDVNGDITNPYTLTGLELATTYSVEVQANCGANGLSEWSTPVSFTTDFCQSENMCAINYSFTDQYNDSWNDAYMNIVDALTGKVLYQLTMPDVTGPYEGSFNVCVGRDIQFVWVSGNYPNECGYVFTDINDEVILEKATSTTAPTAGVVITYTVECTHPTCAKPTALNATAITNNSATLSWTANSGETAWTLYYKKTTDENYTEVTENVTNPYTLTVEASTEYIFYVVANCSETEESEPSATFTFTTQCNPITVDADNPFTENFDAGTFPPTDCWNTISNDTYNWTIDDSENHNEGGSASAYSGYYGDVYLIMPTLTIADNEGPVKLTFWSYNTYTSYYGKNSVVLLGNTETELWSPASVSNSWEETTIDISAYKGQTITLAFKYEGDNAHGWYVDDVWVGYLPSYTKVVESGKWYAISSPVNTPAVNEVDNLTDGNYDFYRYDEASATWENYKAHATDFTTFENCRGYIYRRDGNKNLTFTGFPNTAANYFLTANRADDLKGFNLLGNPFANPYTYGGNCYALTEKGTWMAKTNYTIPVCEAILVKVNITTNYVFSPATKSAPKAVEALAFTVSGNGYEDVTYAMLEEGEGLTKVAHLADEAPALSIPVDGSNYAIAYLGYEVESFPLTLNATAGEYTIALNNQISGLSYCHLLDKETGKETDLLKGAYTFKANGNSDRFTVLLNASIENGEIAIWNGNSWIVNGEGTLQVFDVMGRRVYNQEVEGQSSLNTDELATGVYVIRLGEKSQKIVVK